MRIAHVAEGVDDPASGVSLAIRRLCAALADQGAAIDLLSIADAQRGVEPNAADRDPADRDPADRDFADRDPADRDPADRDLALGWALGTGVTHRRFAPDPAPPPLSALRGSRAMAQAVDAVAGQGAILHVHGLWRLPHLYPARVARRRRTPLVASPHGMLAPSALAFSPLRKRVFRLLGQDRANAQVDLWHASAEGEADDIRAFGARQPIMVAPFGVDAPVDAPDRSGRSVRTVLYLGRLHPIKGVDRLIAAWARVAPDHPDWRLRVVGPGAPEYVATLARQAAATPRVEIAGPAYGADKGAAYAAADLYALPSDSENFALTVAEALGAGLPTICTTGAPWAGLETERCGWWVAPTPDALDAALRAALAAPEATRAEMGARGRAWIARDFSWAAAARRMADAYRWLLGQGPAPEGLRIA